VRAVVVINKICLSHVDSIRKKGIWCSEKKLTRVPVRGAVVAKRWTWLIAEFAKKMFAWQLNLF
jgi:hypothetical protein